MYVWLFALVPVLILFAVSIVMFALGTCSRVSTGRDCEIDVHWWVRCVGGERTGPEEQGILLCRKRGSEDQWIAAGAVPGGSVKWCASPEYQCLSRIPASGIRFVSRSFRKQDRRDCVPQRSMYTE